MEILKSINQKARKDHVCDFCIQEIKIGEVYNYQSLVDSGEFYTWKSHLDCNTIAEKLNMYDECEEGLSSDIFQEYINEEYKNLVPNSIWQGFKLNLKFVVQYHLNVFSED